MLTKIQPAVDSLSGYGAERSSANAHFVHLVAEKNVLLNMARIRNESPVLREMEEAGAIKIAGAMYSMDSGEVAFMGADARTGSSV
jgi:carbonic anhydrase